MNVATKKAEYVVVDFLICDKSHNQSSNYVYNLYFTIVTIVTCRYYKLTGSRKLFRTTLSTGSR